MDNSYNILRVVKRYCRRYAGEAVVTGGSGAREACKELRAYKMDEVTGPIARSDFIDFVPDALLNSISCIDWNEGAKQALRKALNEECCRCVRYSSLVETPTAAFLYAYPLFST